MTIALILALTLIPSLLTLVTLGLFAIAPFVQRQANAFIDAIDTSNAAMRDYVPGQILVRGLAGF